MHIEKNICDSILGTLLNLKGKSKDGLKSRKDLEAIQIRQDLHPKVRGKKFLLRAAPHTFSKVEKRLFRWRLANIKMPDSYGVSQILWNHEQVVFLKYCCYLHCCCTFTFPILRSCCMFIGRFKRVY
ncbi:hypothetical protein RchiOBHm_Chr2g0084301 [Rosa chinensis]|uniref:Uncharacterized protein n=1 Tax=Rosa chinensis TaxID=74649 RepID=A0A2P6RHT2_ROSCH|nr:hypothetical protein RchiOBHm_Chr2g0084301 [Rosa chinensis]